MKKSLIQEALAILSVGGVIAHATDTCYGFACDATNEAALKKLYTLKEMATTKPISLLVADFSMAQQYGEFDERSTALAKKYWPGAVTLIVQRKKTLPEFLNRGVASVGIRVPDHELSRALVRAFGKPITTTSANITTLPSPYSVKEIESQFTHKQFKPDLILRGGRLSKKNLPSTIVDCMGKDLKIVRQGPIFIPIELV